MAVERVSQIENEALYGLLAMADHFMSANPQRIPEALQCWIASLSLSPPAASLRSLTCCKIGLTLYHHTSNIEEAKAYLNQASQRIGSDQRLVHKNQSSVIRPYPSRLHNSSNKITEQGMEPSDATFEAHCLLARIYCDQNLPQQARVVLKGLLDHSLRYPYWHLRFLFQLADVSVAERDSQGVIAHLSKASDYAALIKADYPRLLSLLSQGAYQLTVGKYGEGAQVLNQCGQLLEGYSGPRGPSLKAFYLVIQVTHLLWAGQPKSAKPHLRQLQHCIKEIDSESLPSSGHSAVPLNVESFEWLSKQQLYALIYLVCMMYNLQAGNTEKVISYGEKASAVMAQQQGSGVEGSPSPKARESSMMKVIKAYVLEHLMAVKLMQGRYSEVSPLMEEVLCVCYGHSKLVYSHRALIHLFLGFYAYHNDVLDRAAAQFSCALQHTNVAELKTFITLNLALTYVRMGEDKEHDLAAVMETLRPEAVNPVCQGLRAAVMYMNGLHAYLTLKINDAKHCLREALVLTNSNDLHKLTACCLVLLGQIYFSLGNKEAAYNMANTSHQLANKMPDTALLSWSLGLLGYLEQENGTQSYWGQLDALKQQMVAERNKAANTAQYQLIQWAVGEWPVCVRQGSSEQKEQDRPSLSAPYKGLIPFGNSVSLSPVTSPQLRQPVLHHAVPTKFEVNQLKGKTLSHLPLQLSPTNSTGPAALQLLHASTQPSVSDRQASFMVADGRGSEGAQSPSSQRKDVSTTVALPVKPPSSSGVQQKKQSSSHPTPGPLSPPSRNLPNHSSPQRSETVAQAIPSGAVYGWPPLQPHPHPHPQHGSPVAGGHLQPTQPLPPNVYALQQYQQQMWLQQQLAQQQVVRQTQQQQLVRQAQQQQLTHQAQQQQQQRTHQVQQQLHQAQQQQQQRTHQVQQQLHQAQQQQQQRTHQVQQQLHQAQQQKLHQAQQQQLHQAQQQQLHQAQQQQQQLHQAQQQQLAHQAQHLQRASEQVQKQQLGRQAQQQASKQQLASWPPLVSALPTSPPSASSQRRTHAMIPSLQPQTALILGASSHAGAPVSVSPLQGRTAQQQQQQQQLYTSQPFFHQPLGRLQLPPGYRIQPPP